MTTKQKFEDVADGYGFDEVEQRPDGMYCTGCYTVHKRPTKLYANGPTTHDGRPTRPGVEVLCKFQVVRLYGDQ